MAAAAGIINDASAYLSPTREYNEPSLEKDDWPRDLRGPETARMLEHLADIAYGASRCITGVRSQHAVADATKPELDAIADLLARAALKLSTLPGNPGQEEGATIPAQHPTRTQPELATESFPEGPATSPLPTSDTEEPPARGPDSAVRQRLAQGPGIASGTASTVRQGRP